MLTRSTNTGRIPIGYRSFRRDVERAGLSITGVMATRPGISQQWNAVLSGDA